MRRLKRFTAPLAAILLIGCGWLLWHSGAIGGAFFVSALLSSITVSVGFGLQGYLSNIVAGFALRAEGNVIPGHVLTVQGYSGTIVAPPGARITKLTGPDGAVVPVPNQVLFTAPFTVKPPEEEKPCSKDSPLSSPSLPRS